MKPIITRAFQSFLICVLCSASLSCDRSKDNNSSTQQRIDSNEKILEALRPISPREPKGPAGPKLESASAYINLSLRYYNEGRWEECIDACIEALDLDPNSAVAYNNICSAYNRLKDYDRAILACTKAIALDPDFQLAKNNLNVARKNKVSAKRP